MNFRRISLLIAVPALFFASCSNDDDNNQEEPLGAYENGVFVLNEGNYGTDNSTISYLSDDFSTFQADAYGAVNGGGVGNTGQDIGFYDNMAFIVVNGSNKIEIVNRYTLEPVGTVSSGLSNPRYITFANGKGYVTNWGDASSATDDYVAVINLTGFSVESTISVGEGPERVEEENGKLYVALKGGWNNGNAVSVIDPATNTVTATITVGDIPNSLAAENGYLYVLCGGIVDWSGSGGDTNGTLAKINLSDNTFTTLDFPSGSHPSNLDIENGTMYYTIDSSVYSMSTSATALPSTPILSVADQGVYGIYGFQVEDGKVYIGDAGDYNSNGSIYIFNTSGTLLYENTVRVSPNGFYFNN